jgi:hypothetical protein
VKYLAPDSSHVPGILINAKRLQELGELDWKEFMEWVKQTNPAWIPFLARGSRLYVLQQALIAVNRLAEKIFWFSLKINSRF